MPWFMPASKELRLETSVGEVLRHFAVGRWYRSQSDDTVLVKEPRAV